LAPLPDALPRWPGGPGMPPRHASTREPADTPRVAKRVTVSMRRGSAFENQAVAVTT
jgi:hypothetical protein